MDGGLAIGGTRWGDFLRDHLDQFVKRSIDYDYTASVSSINVEMFPGLPGEEHKYSSSARPDDWTVANNQEGSEVMCRDGYAGTHPHHPVGGTSLIVERIAHFATWPTMVTMAAVCHDWRINAQLEAELRILWVLRHILPIFAIDAEEFLYFLEICGGAVVGSVAHRLLMIEMDVKGCGSGDHGEDCFAGWTDEQGGGTTTGPLRRLSVMVAPGRLHLFRRLVDSGESDGWKVVEVDDIAGGKRYTANILEWGVGIGRLRVIEAKETVIACLVNSSTTGDMVAISHDRVLVIYPCLSLANKAIVRWFRPEHETALPRDRPCYPKEHPLDQPWSFSCSTSCPARWRKAQRGEGIAEFFWSRCRERMVVEQVAIAKMIGYMPDCCGGLRGEAPCHAVLAAWEADSLLDGDETTFKWRVATFLHQHE
ncbi:hypothetical protein BKA70DRAFT_1241914 [Coprinopsis sp. MPI-PUGE-AT-0042]|nr:hypothetical protein BKA70DRAFT_1241914 [Coprinopsis sp. MPI-PUGE-AT-0042]